MIGGSKPSPRHLVLSRDGKSVYVSTNVSGWVEKFEAAAVSKAAYSQGGGQNAPKSIKPSRQVRLGAGVRTIALHPHKNLLLAVVNRRLMIFITGDVCAKDGSLLDFAFARARKNQPRAETPDAVAALWGEAVWKARWRGEIDGGMCRMEKFCVYCFYCHFLLNSSTLAQILKCQHYFFEQGWEGGFANSARSDTAILVVPTAFHLFAGASAPSVLKSKKASSVFTRWVW